MGEPHKWAEVIKAAADGKDVQSRVNNHYPWRTHSGAEAIRDCAWEDYHEYRIKPEPVFPVTRMSQQQIKKAFHASAGETEKGWRGIANAAIKRAIEDGDVILPNKD